MGWVWTDDLVRRLGQLDERSSRRLRHWVDTPVALRVGEDASELDLLELMGEGTNPSGEEHVDPTMRVAAQSCPCGERDLTGAAGLGVGDTAG